MVDGGGKALRVVALSLAILNLANAQNSRSEDSAKIVSAESSDQETTNIDNYKMEARWEEDPPAIKSVKHVGWKSGRLSWAKDSYLEALKHSRTSTDPREGVIGAAGEATSGSTSFQRRKEYVQGPVYSGKDEESGTSPRIVHGAQDRDSFSLPTRTSGDFGAVQNTYGPPQPPRGSYGPPSNGYSPYGEYSGGAYLPPQQAYGPPAPTYGAGVPHGITDISQITLPTIDFSWPFALKLNAFTIAKILLKLVIFKMIVKFIAIICLLLFIPKLEIKKDNKGDMHDDDDEGRGLLVDSWVSERLNLLTLVLNNAVEKYENLNKGRWSSNEECSTMECRIQRAFTHDETWQDYRQLLRSYVSEESRSVRAKS
ncbi:uncharacterized protein LOC143374075 isoform X2 [Andrena cerasifolii]|uniref:uncharacterized protein LOC143374075 isoform X2 n=1 Tax=Andrena cerasifolii TaxID=2819439 RepID=UPI004037D8E2